MSAWENLWERDCAGRSFGLRLVGVLPQAAAREDFIRLLRPLADFLLVLDEAVLLTGLRALPSARRQGLLEGQQLVAVFVTVIAGVLSRRGQEKALQAWLGGLYRLLATPRVMTLRILRRTVLREPSWGETEAVRKGWLAVEEALSSFIADPAQQVVSSWCRWLTLLPTATHEMPGLLRWDSRRAVVRLAGREDTGSLWSDEDLNLLRSQGWLTRSCWLSDPFSAAPIAVWKLGEKSRRLLRVDFHRGKFAAVRLACLSLRENRTCRGTAARFFCFPLTASYWVRLPVEVPALQLDALAGAIEKLREDPELLRPLIYAADPVAVLCVSLRLMPQLRRGDVRELLSLGAIFPNGTRGRWPAGIFARPFGDDAEPVLVMSLTQDAQLPVRALDVALEVRLVQRLEALFLAGQAQFAGRMPSRDWSSIFSEEFLASLHTMPGVRSRLAQMDAENFAL